MDKQTVLQKLQECGIVAVVRGNSVEEAIAITDACVAGGVTAIELTFTVPQADKVITELCDRYQDNPDVLIGAGTVLDPETARAAMLAGAQYIVSPSLNIETLQLCNSYAVPMIPGIMTVREALMALENGADILKVFPADLFGPKIIKDILGPVPHAKLMPTGGVHADNVAEWIHAGAVAVGAGSSLTAGAKTGDYAAITETAKKFKANILAARAK